MSAALNSVEMAGDFSVVDILMTDVLPDQGAVHGRGNDAQLTLLEEPNRCQRVAGTTRGVSA